MSTWCKKCQSKEKKTQKCGACLRVSYCSKSCQIDDWQNHRDPCQTYRKLKHHFFFEEELQYVNQKPFFITWMTYLKQMLRKFPSCEDDLLILKPNGLVRDYLCDEWSRIFMLTPRTQEPMDPKKKSHDKMDFEIGVYNLETEQITQKSCILPMEKEKSLDAFVKKKILKEFFDGNVAFVCNPNATTLRESLRLVLPEEIK